ncbi:MAG: hypothetical protein HY720_27250, partial [Planctomycetes bacterium]|nr:hypothetical protein [Planctomycetota bacterium]
SDRKKLAAEDRVPKRVLTSELDDAQTHAQELRNIVFCQYNPSVPAVRIWKDYTDPERPQSVALSPFSEGYMKYDDSVSGGFLYSYLTVVGVLIISSALSFVGIKSAGG